MYGCLSPTFQGEGRRRQWVASSPLQTFHNKLTYVYPAYVEAGSSNRSHVRRSSHMSDEGLRVYEGGYERLLFGQALVIWTT